MVNRYGGAVGWWERSGAGAGVEPDGEAAVAVTVENGLDALLEQAGRTGHDGRDGAAADLDVTERQPLDSAQVLADTVGDVAGDGRNLHGDS